MLNIARQLLQALGQLLRLELYLLPLHLQLLAGRLELALPPARPLLTGLNILSQLLLLLPAPLL